jgi:Swt1-like HEPN
MKGIDDVYRFVFKGQLTDAALDRAGRKRRHDLNFDAENLRRLLGVDVLDIEFVASAERMSLVYVTVAAFENSARELVTRVLLEAEGEDWWEKCVSERIKNDAKKRMEAEQQVRWHVQRGGSPIKFTMLPNLANIIANNFEKFEAYLHDVEWVKSVFEVVERSRNVIMHSGVLSDRDMARLGSLIRDWNSQVSI